MKKQTLGDKINRGFVLIVIVLGTIMAIRFAVAVVKHDTEYIERESDFLYPETQDDLGETANGLDVPRSIVDTTVDEAYVDGFFKE